MTKYILIFYILYNCLPFNLLYTRNLKQNYIILLFRLSPHRSDFHNFTINITKRIEQLLSILNIFYPLNSLIFYLRRFYYKILLGIFLPQKHNILWSSPTFCPQIHKTSSLLRSPLGSI